MSLAALGAEIAMATSCDENFPPENVLDGKTETFWASTGLFPQELIISFKSEVALQSVKIHCSNVRKLVLYTSSKNEPINFEKIAEKDLESVDGRLQSPEIPLRGSSASHLRLVIASGHDHFVSVHNVDVKAD